MSTQWYYAKGGQQAGPVSEEELRSLVSTGAVSAQDLVWREGMAQWAPAASVPELASPGIPSAMYNPAGPAPLSYGPPQTRPTSVTVLAIIGIIFASLGILGGLCTPFLLMGSRGMAGNPALQGIPTGWLIASAVIGFVLAVLLMGASIASLKLIPWGRTGMITYAGLSIVMIIISLFMNLARGGSPSMPNLSPSAMHAITFGSALLQLIFPICILIFMSRPHVKAAFAAEGMRSV